MGGYLELWEQMSTILKAMGTKSEDMNSTWLESTWLESWVNHLSSLNFIPLSGKAENNTYF